MGCNTSNATELQQQILPLPIDVINAYIDRVSIVMINKIKDKFQSQLPSRQQQMDEVHFVHLFNHSQINDNRKRNLFAYFTNNTKNKLKINKFIEKYCILIKSDCRHFSQILHRIYCKGVDVDRMLLQDYQSFQDDCIRYFNEGVYIPLEKFPLIWSQFFQLTKDKVNWEGLQSSLQIVSIDELPYKSFHNELQKFNTELLRKGTNYFVVSAQWISQWIFFYQYQDTDIKNSNYRSNKSTHLLRKKSLTTKRRVSKPRLNSSKIFANENSQMSVNSLLPPTQINFTEIEGQYLGQLKPLLVVERDIAVVNASMWSILKNTLGSTIEFERQAIDEVNVDLYPVFVYFYRVDSSSNIDSQSLTLTKAKRSLFFTHFKKLLPPKKGSKVSELSEFYYKNFDQTNFTVWNSENCIQQIVEENPRTIIVQVPIQSTKKFVSKYFREEVKIQNITVGDKVLAYFSYQDKFVEAYVINFHPHKKELKIHFIGFSYNYERWVKLSDIKLLQNIEQNQGEGQKKDVLHEKEAFFWGIPNIGNTCFLNSILQSLAATSIFDQFFLKANLSQKKYPLSHDFSKIMKGLLNREKFNVTDFKKVVNTKMPIFSGYDQHDAQQFLNLLLDSMDEQLKQKPNIIDQLFGGIMESKFTCLKCRQTKTKEEKIHSISLPIPESEFNYFTIMVFPIYSSNVRRIILRLHKNAKVSQYLNDIQTRSNINRFDFLFVQANFSTLKKYRSDLTFQANQDKKITDIGLNSNTQLWAYEKLRKSSIEYQLKKKFAPEKDNIEQGNFYDYYSNEEASWGIAKIVKIWSDQVKIQFLKDSQIKEIQLKRQQNLKDQFIELGSKVFERIFRKIYMRRWSQSASKMVFFQSQLFIGLPKWSSYRDSLLFLDENLQKIRLSNPTKMSKHSSASNSFEDLGSQQILNQDQLRLTGMNSTFMEERKLPYVIHFLEPQKNVCIFCKQQLQHFHCIQEVKSCCEPQQKDIPLFWASEQKSLYFIIDWVDISDYNENYFHQVEMDNHSISAQQKMKEQKISLDQCLDLWKKPQTIEMQCEKCKFEQHLLETSIKKSPIITVFHLKEFRYTEEGHFLKLNINLQWTESINLQEYYSEPKSTQKGNIYEMYSVISHKGSTSSGHYTCMAKRKHPLERLKVWVNFDDDKTEIIKQKPQIIDNAYLLFFKKVDIPSSAVVHFSI